MIDMIRVLFCDFDGTLILHLPDRSYIPQENIEAVERMRSSGLHFVMTTGRAMPEFLALSKGFDEGSDFIGGNGSVVLFDDGSSDIRFLDSGLLIELFTRMRETVQQFDFFFYIDNETEVGYDNLDGKATEGEFERIVEILRANDGHVNIASLRTRDNDDQIKMEEMLEREFAGRITVSIPTPVIIDFTAWGVNKGIAIGKFCDHYGIGKEETAGIGDGRNDLAIFEGVSCRFAMNSGHPLLKGKADYCVDSVAEAIDMIMEMNQKEKDEGR
ncbi:MAG: HAD family phosphatase [Erysipelotrichaceae bacterium]|nr:HAD family phosphatase [Erysipelotrichaceae bacterium]